ncbi:MAG TPA: radical SAM protein [Thermoanaerobaculia bacterium]|nr:radical SAM protein [Thermoanaerobaculia bacterium]
MGSISRTIEWDAKLAKRALDAIDVRDLIVPGLGNRRIFRILLTNACRHACDWCPMRAERDLPPAALEPAKLARLFMTAFRRGWCDGLFVTSGIPKDAVRAMDGMLELVETLRVTHGYRGYLHVKALAGAQPGQIEKLVRLVDRVSYNLEIPCQRAADESARDPLAAPVRDVAAAIREARRDSARKAPPALLERRLVEADHLLRDYGFRASELPFDEDGHLPLDQDPKLAWARRHPERFPVELTTAPREELQRVPGFGPRAVERILLVRGRDALRDLTDLRRLGVRVGRAAGYVTLKGQLLGTRVTGRPKGKQGALFQGTTSSRSKLYDFGSGAFR